MTGTITVCDSVQPNAFLGQLSQAEAAVLSLVRREPGLSRAEIAVRLKLSPALLTKVVTQFAQEGLVAEQRRSPKGRGQPALRLSIQPRSVGSIGVSLSTDGLVVAMLDLNGELLEVERSKVSAANTAQAIEALHKGIERVLEHTASLAGIGIWTPAMLDSQGCIVEITPTQRAIDFTGIVQALRARYCVPVWLQNRAFAIYESMLPAHLGPVVYYVALDFGVGGMLMDHMRLFVGGFGQASNIGALVPETGPRPSLPDLTQYLGMAPSSLDLAMVAKLAEARDPRLHSWIASRGQALSTALSSVVQLINPNDIVIGGAFPRPVFEGLIKHINLDQFDLEGRKPLNKPRLHVASLVGPDSLAISAAAVPFYHQLRSL